MLTVYRRHLKRCEHRDEGRHYRRCQCPIWVDGTLNGREIRQSLDMRDWQRAQDLVRQWEAAGQRDDQPRRMTVKEAWERFLADAEARKLQPATVEKYKLLRRKMEAFAEQHGGLAFMDQFDLDVLSDFRSQWKCGPRTGLKQLERLRAFFRFAQKRKWIADNPAADLKAPKIPPSPTLPFTRDEMRQILEALETYSASAGARNGQRLRAFVLLLRYSGMRIGDAAQLTTERIVGDRLFLYTQKTGQPVNVLLPKFVAEALDACPRGSDRHFFWTGRSTVHSVIGKWQRRLARLFQLAGVPKGHAHRFRDTFAVEFLLAGGTLEQLSVLLGHSSLRITERHYAPWVGERQQQLEAQLARAWALDPIALAETKGTYQVRSEKGPHNRVM